jgi:GNAT superfamily N-acetyltransferase
MADPTFRLEVADSADEQVRKAIAAPLVAYNQSRAGPVDSRPLVVIVKDAAGEVVGGLWGRTAYGWLFVELLAVPESLRGSGIGREVMGRAEQEAIRRGCHGAWLDTFEFQARGFYEKLGYTCFGELADYPTGFSRYFMKKTFEHAAGLPDRRTES